jgi:hypothetical protein
MVRNEYYCWHEINHTLFQPYFEQTLQTLNGAKQLERKLRGLTKKEVIAHPILLQYLTELEVCLEKTYQQLGVSTDTLASYGMYGDGQRVNNFGCDEVEHTLPTLKALLENDHQIDLSIATVIGDGYPRLWREAFPLAKITAFDINPLQHLRWSHYIGSPEGANVGYLVDAGVYQWFLDFLKEVKPSILYLSNVMFFLRHNLEQTQATAQAILETAPEYVISTLVRHNPEELAFAEALAEQYGLTNILLPPVYQGDEIYNIIFSLKKNSAQKGHYGTRI